MAQIAELQRELGFSVLFITHDMSLMIQLSHRMAVMYAGRFVETAESQAIFAEPRHPYTRALIDAFPPLDGPARSRSRDSAKACGSPTSRTSTRSAPATGSRRFRPAPPALQRRTRMNAVTTAQSTAPPPLAARPVGQPPWALHGLPHRRGPLPPGRPRAALGGPRPLPRRDRGPGRGVGQRQEHDRPLRRPAAAADLRLDPARRGRRAPQRAETRLARVPEQGPDGVPGPVRLAEPGAPRGVHPRARGADPRPASRARARSGHAWRSS